MDITQRSKVGSLVIHLPFNETHNQDIVFTPSLNIPFIHPHHHHLQWQVVLQQCNTISNTTLLSHFFPLLNPPFFFSGSLSLSSFSLSLSLSLCFFVAPPPDGGRGGRPVHRSNGGWFRGCGCVVIGVGWYRHRSPVTRSEGEEGNREPDEVCV
ncbi:hypothetical protein Hdeb2414_s0010g00354281 [Helianthus debilis subsp. tardiflorus]